MNAPAKAPRRALDLTKLKINRYRALHPETPERQFAAWVITDGFRWPVGPFFGSTEEQAVAGAQAFYESQMAERERLRALNDRRVEAMAAARRK